MISRITRQGFPAANTPSGMSLVTTLPAPMTDFEPITNAGTEDRPAADPHIGTDLDGPGELLRPAQVGVHRVRGGVDWTAGPNSVKSPISTRHTSRTTQLKLKKTRSPSRMFEP